MSDNDNFQIDDDADERHAETIDGEAVRIDTPAGDGGATPAARASRWPGWLAGLALVAALGVAAFGWVRLGGLEQAIHALRSADSRAAPAAALKARLTQLSSQVEADASGAAEMASRVQALAQKLDALATRLDALDGRLIPLAGQVDKLERRPAAKIDDAAVQSLLDKSLEAVKSRVDALDARVARLAGGFDEMRRSQRAEAQGPDTALSLDLDKQQRELAGLSERIAKLAAAPARADAATGRRLDRLAERLDQQAAALAGIEQRLASGRDDMAARISEMRKALDQATAKLADASRRDERGQLLSLLRQAARAARLPSDVPLALAMLEDAEHLLPKGAGSDALRQALREDIAALRAFQPLDRAAVDARLRMLRKQVAALKLPQPERDAAAGPTAPATPAEDRSWRSLADDVVEQLKSVVKVSRRDRPLDTLIQPGQRLMIRRGLQLQLDAAGAGLLRGDALLYQESLKRLRDGLKTYFGAAASGAISEVDALLRVDVRPAPPTADRALKRLLASASDGEG
ncbi:MAG TPA: hypothetical protein ENJ21_01925 [Chromatiaceae bacterium]|nr:hypothetical protein [Chromatiaceae bacterium]